MRLSLTKLENIAVTIIIIPDISFMSPIPSTSGKLHSEFVRLLFLQDHRETDRFFTTSGVLLDCGLDFTPSPFRVSTR